MAKASKKSPEEKLRVVGYATKLALACPVSTTQGATDLISALGGAAEALLGQPLVEDCTDAATGEIIPLVIVTNNGPAMKSVAVARWFAARPHLAHIRTRHRAPWTEVAPVGLVRTGKGFGPLRAGTSDPCESLRERAG